MDKGVGSGLFANDGSFMERFKQMQDNEKAAASSVAPRTVAVAANKRPLDLKAGEIKKAGSVASGGKLAFSLKKAKVAVVPVKFAADDDEEDVPGVEEEPAKLQKSVQADARTSAAPTGVVVPPPPNDMTVRQVADKLASFVAKNGRQFENVTRQRNPGDTPFKFLFDKNCPDYKYYEFRLAEEGKVLAQSKEGQASKNANSSIASSRAHSGPQRISYEQKSNYQTPASALYGAYEGSSSQGSSSNHDPVALMEFYMKKAAQEERKRPYRQSKDEMPPPASLQGPPSKKGHHMGDFIPPEELEKFMACCNDAVAQKATKEAAEKAKIQADNIGHKLLSKMGWREELQILWELAATAKWLNIYGANIRIEKSLIPNSSRGAIYGGFCSLWIVLHSSISDNLPRLNLFCQTCEGLGSERSGRADPIMAGDVKKDHLGVGAVQPGEVTAEDDIYEQYKKRMMLGYRYRPNPLNNPRKAYY